MKAWEWDHRQRSYVLPRYLRLPYRERMRARALLRDHPEAAEQPLNHRKEQVG